MLLCIGSNSTITDPNRFKLDSDQFYLRSEAEMRALFPDHPEAADNTWAIAEQVDMKLPFGRTLLPDPGDHMVLELAVESTADFIVTFNARDFRPAVQFGIRIVTPAEFLAILEKVA